MPKIHKTPTQLRPVVSCVNSFPSIFSTWLDFRMKELLHLIPSYIKNSTDLIKELRHINLPKGAKLFTADATSMYTNIDTATGIQTFKNLFDKYTAVISTNFPKEFFLQTLEIVMNYNIFSFGDTYWQQLKGTAMGTPAAPLYSILITIVTSSFTKDILMISLESGWTHQKQHGKISNKPWINSVNYVGTLRIVLPLRTSLILILTSYRTKSKRKLFKKNSTYTYTPPLHQLILQAVLRDL
jgi:hypothetical protein